MDAPQCSVIIRCFNEEAHIGRLLDGLAQQTNRNFETIIVDSGSTDSTLAIAGRHPARILNIKPEEFSFGRSLNLGCSEARGEFIVLASAHVYPLYKDWLDHLLAPFREPQIALVYGKQKGEKTSKFSEQRVFAQWYPAHSNLQQDHPFCNNANAAIRKSLWLRIPYDESLTGLEDLDWAKRVLQLGYRLAYCADAEIIHVHSETPMRIYNRYRREAIAFKHIFPHEKFSFWDFVRLFVTNSVHDYSHARSESALAKNFWEISTFRLMQFWGTYRGFFQHGPVTNKLRRTFYYPASTKTHTPADAEADKKRRVDYTEGHLG